jgi:YVTN family beta-propeller protein
VFAVDTASHKVLARIATGPRPRAIAFTRDGGIGFVSNENDSTVTVFDAATHQVTATVRIPPTEGTPMPPRPMGVALSPDGRHVFVSLGRAKSIAILDAGKGALIRTIEDVGTRPWGIGATDKRIQVGGSPWGIAVAVARQE